jgi:glutathione S-transferase
MQLIGMLDSPYVRRVAIALQFMGLRFTHDPLSVFRTFDEFRAINPVVKAPSLVCDDGVVLMDSTLILDYAAALAGPGRPLMPAALAERQHALRLIGLALAACEKSVQLVYEKNLRPEEKRHQPWTARVALQLQAAFDLLEAELERRPLRSDRGSIDLAGITLAVAWRFAREMTPEAVPPAGRARIAAFGAAAETLPEFQAAQYGSGTYAAAH